MMCIFLVNVTRSTMVMNNKKKGRSNNKKKGKNSKSNHARPLLTAGGNRHIDSVFMRSITCTHGSTIENFLNGSGYQDAIDEWVNNELNVANAEDLIMLMLAYNEKHKALMKDPAFITHVFAYGTATFLKYNGSGSTALTQKSILKLIRYGLGLGLTMRYGSETEKHMKYARDIHTERGIINCLHRETTMHCSCMEPYKEAAKTMDKVGVCYGCRNEFPKNRLFRCSQCRAVQYCGKDCMKEHWPKHKVYCVPIDQHL